MKEMTKYNERIMDKYDMEPYEYVMRAKDKGNAFHLETFVTKNFSHAYSDRGCGAKKDVSVWKPELPAGFYTIGYVANNSKEAPKHCVVVKDNSPD